MNKITFLISSIGSSGGTERVTSDICNKLVNIGYDIGIISLYNGNKSYFDLDKKIKLLSLYPEKISFSKKFPAVIYKLRKYLKKNNVDILVNVDSILTLYSIPATTLLDVSNICWEHFNFNIDLGLKKRKYARYLASIYCQKIITLTERDKYLWEENSYARCKVHVIPNPSPFVNIPIELNQPSSKIVISVGRLTNQKGFDLLLKAWKKVLEKRTDWTLKIIGSGHDENYLKSLAEKLNVDSHIIWVKHSNNIIEQYKSSALYVMSSRFEGLPMVLLEAASMGVPTVSFDCDTGPREIITNKTGWLCENGNINALASTLIHAMNILDDQNMYNSYRASSKKNIDENFSIDTIIDKWIGVIEDKK
ncbi:glycosyltransferase family 4 protein [Providencia rettgeri]|uniref:Glycosyltransferase family 4 protein n=1 Tax=Providencia rettgeri TaxID=587 RepID=A0AAW6UKN1_PRORE|nr:glycosyltransferase family 4 protein [Providencia rettgeri]ELR5235890.1 glycosyltransferase family 4 protein [Providencia rettgeri]ELU1337257.1 glycosyltransferase family 4 protein [Providencia rettgeri]EMC2742563.1 glycosyltransferase family 4 protein [Providencia rettgeri]EMD6655766.1 glycosyltransferase family 4 protein [Providencia rettgeri]